MTIRANFRLSDVQFSGNTETDAKLRRLVEDFRNVESLLRAIIDEINNAGTGTGGGGTTQHVLATTSGLGMDHTTGGLTAGMVLKAFSADNAQFAHLRFGEMEQVDPETFVSVPNGYVLTMFDGYYSMKPQTVGGLGDPGADAFATWNVDSGEWQWRLPGPGIVMTDGLVTLDLSGTEHSGEAEINFGAAADMSADTTVTVIGQAGIAGASPQAWLIGSSTADHSPDEHLMAQQLLDLVCTAPVGDSFSIYALVRSGTMAGRFKVQWRW